MNRYISLILYLLLAPFIGAFLDGIDRKITARMQGRKGPSIWQPFYDLYKLFSKQMIAVNSVQLLLNCSYLIFLAIAGGMVFFGTTLGFGYSILTGALTLTLMVLPLITRNTQEALKTVPESYRSGALGMGATKWYMIRTILLPSAMPGIITGIILAVGRIVGESAALLFTAGSGYLLPKSGMGFLHKILESGGTLTIQLYLCMSKAQYGEAFGIAVVLLVLVLGINMLTKYLSGKFNVETRE